MTIEYAEPTIAVPAKNHEGDERRLRALIKEAKARQRRRWLAQASAAAGALALVTVGLTVFRTGGPGATTVPRTSSPKVAALPACSLASISAVAHYTGGAAGTLYYNVELTNNGAACHVTALEARAYDAPTHSLVGFAAHVLPGQASSALTNQRLAHGATAIAQLGYVDGAVGSSGCGVVHATDLALWTSGHASAVRYVHLAVAGSPLKVCTTRSYLTLYWPTVSATS